MSTTPFSPLSTTTEPENGLASPTPASNVEHSAALVVPSRTTDSPSRGEDAKGLSDSHDRDNLVVSVEGRYVHFELNAQGGPRWRMSIKAFEKLFRDERDKNQACTIIGTPKLESVLRSSMPACTIGHSAVGPGLDVPGRTRDSPSRRVHANGLYPESHDRDGLMLVIDWTNLSVGLAQNLGDPNALLDPKKLQTLMCGERPKVQARILTSHGNPPNEKDKATWKLMKSLSESDPDTFFRSFVRTVKGQEKIVDVEVGAILSDIATVYDGYRRRNKSSNHPEHHIPERIVLVCGGDRDYFDRVVRLVKDGIPVEQWAWKNSIAADYRELEEEFSETKSREGYPLFQIFELDPHASKICYYEAQSHPEPCPVQNLDLNTSVVFKFDTAGSNGRKRLSTIRRWADRTGLLYVELVQPTWFCIFFYLPEPREHYERTRRMHDCEEKTKHGKHVIGTQLSSRLKSAKDYLGPHGFDTRKILTIPEFEQKAKDAPERCFDREFCSNSGCQDEHTESERHLWEQHGGSPPYIRLKAWKCSFPSVKKRADCMPACSSFHDDEPQLVSSGFSSSVLLWTRTMSVNQLYRPRLVPECNVTNFYLLEAIFLSGRL